MKLLYTNYCAVLSLAYLSIVAKCPGLAGTVPVFGPMSRLCPGLPDFAALSQNPAREHCCGLGFYHFVWLNGAPLAYDACIILSR